MKTLKTTDGYLGYLDQEELTRTQQALDEARQNLDVLDQACRSCGAPGYAKTDDGRWICIDHYYN